MVRLCCQDRNCTPSPSQWQRVPGHACDPSGAPLTQLPRGGSHRSSGGWHMPAPTTQAATETAAEARRSPRNAGDSAHLSPWPTVAHPAPAAEAEHTGRSPGDRVCLTPLPRGASAQPQCPRHSSRGGTAPTSEVAALAAPPPCRDDWLSKRKVEKAPQRAARLRESAIPRKS